MASEQPVWRDAFGIAPGANPDFEEILELYRKRVSAADWKGDDLQTLAAALEAARLEISPRSVVDGTVHKEQLLPP